LYNLGGGAIAVLVDCQALMAANCRYMASQAEELFALLAEGPEGLPGLKELRLAETGTRVLRLPSTLLVGSEHRSWHD
jgi:hypothetical protein